jgi:uncharacterized membrane protein YqjE
METPGDNTPGLFASFKRLLKTVFAIAQNRLELLLVEAQEERARFFELLLLAGIVLVLALMTLMLVTVIVVVLCVRADRLDLLFGLSLVGLAATLGFLWRLRTRLKTWTPFSATLAELKNDKACLYEKN